MATVCSAFCLSACAAPLPQSAYPIEPKIADALTTSEFTIDSNVKFSDGCGLFNWFGCHSDFWEVCVRFNNVPAMKKATNNDYKGPDSDFDFAMKSGFTMVFRDDKWYLGLEHSCKLPPK